MNKKIIYTPTMHESLAPKELPKDVLFMRPGLPSSEPSDSIYVPENLPYPPAQAETVLRELVSMGSTLAREGSLKFMAGQSWLQTENSAQRKSELEEKRLLEKVARTGSVDDTQPAETITIAPNNTEYLHNAQKTLLLAWEHENYCIEIAALKEKITAGDRLLQNSLGALGINEHELHEIAGANIFEDEAAAGTIFENEPESSPGYDWRIIVDAMGALLPQSAILLTADEEIFDALNASALLNPLPESLLKEFAHWPEDFTAFLLYAQAPLWRITGHSRPLPERAHMEKTCEIIVASRPVKV